MEITVEELKIQPDEIISYVGQGYDITIIYKGKAYAKIIPFDDGSMDAELDDSEDGLFGLWKDRIEVNDVDLYVRRMRQGRKL